MRPVYFVKYFEKASTILAGDQVAEALRGCGIEAHAVSASETSHLRDAILVFIKTSRLDHLVRARLRGNVLIQDPHDTLVFKRLIKNRWLYDGVIFRNRASAQDFARPGIASRVIPLHWDPRCRPRSVDDSVLRVGYLGDPRSMRLYGKIPGVAFVSDDYFAHLGRFNCHLSLRSGSKEMRYKPAVKVSIAAACGANIVTTRDASAIELLGDDYPYYTEPGLDAVTATIEHARATLGGPVWRAGLERMRGVAERTRLDRLLDSYVDFFASFD
jgi:hypothetical protein